MTPAANRNSPPNVERLMGRVDEDILSGEAWRARQRLRNYAAQFKTEPRFAARLGAMQLAIGELPDAERMLCGGCSLEPEHQAIIAAYLARQDTRAKFASATRQSLLHASRGTALSPATVEAIESRALVVDEEIARVTGEKENEQRMEAHEGLLFKLGCAVSTVLGVVVLLLGIRSFVQIFAGWFS